MVLGLTLHEAGLHCGWDASPVHTLSHIYLTKSTYSDPPKPITFYRGGRKPEDLKETLMVRETTYTETPHRQ